MQISVVIPPLNEVENIGTLLELLSRTPTVFEVIVVDGGSTDRTREIVGASGARLVECKPGRGLQLNAGAAEASGNVLLFLHADVAPPLDLAAQIRGILGRSRVEGNFRLRYPGGGLLGRWLEALAPFYRSLNR